MPKQGSNVVTEFVLSTIPESLLDSYRLLAQLEYPVQDKHSLECQLDGIIKNTNSLQVEQHTVNLIVENLRATDFPITTARNALEKFHERIFPSIEPPRLPEPIPREPTERPSISDIYRETFGDLCGRQATEAYLQATRSGLSELQAVIVGHQEGRRCERRLAELLRDFLRRGPFRF